MYRDGSYKAEKKIKNTRLATDSEIVFTICGQTFIYGATASKPATISRAGLQTYVLSTVNNLIEEEEAGWPKTSRNKMTNIFVIEHSNGQYVRYPVRWVETYKEN